MGSIILFLCLFDKDILLNKISIDNYFPEGNEPKIEMIFFNNYQFRKNLIVLVSWDQKIKHTIEGKLYKVYVYHLKKFKNKITVDKSRDLFDLEFEGRQEGKVIKAHFITKENIVRRMKAL